MHYFQGSREHRPPGGLAAPVVCGCFVSGKICYLILCVHYSFTKIPKRKSELVASIKLSSKWNIPVIVLCIFLTVLWVGL